MPHIRHIFRSVLVLVLALVLGLVTFSQAANAQGRFYLHNGDRVVFYGDSITDQRLYTTFVETFVVTRCPRMNVSFVHSGWGGDRVTGGGGGPIDLRLKRDVFAYKPTVVTIMLGMNDASYRTFDQGIFNTYSTGFEHIVQSIKENAPNARITLIQPSPFDDVTRKPNFEGGYNAVLVRYGQFLKELAGRNHLDLADLNTSVVAALEKANATDPVTAAKIIPDRVHPLQGGHLLMAAALLKAWNAPAVVSDVELAAGRDSVVKAVNARVRRTGDLSWTQVDSALPMPIDMNDPAVALSIRSSDVVETLNQQRLTVTGLTAARYALKIDGEEVGSFTREQLGSGVNLALLNTPMAKQAREVHYLTLLHNDLHFTRWRNVQVPRQNMITPTLQGAMDAIDAGEAGVVKQQRQAAQPKEHTFELVPQ